MEGNNPQEFSNAGQQEPQAAIQVKFFVGEMKLGLIKARMAQLGIENMSAYLRKVAIDGYEEKPDSPELREPKNP